MKYLKIFTDFKNKVELLNAEEIGRLFIAMLKYAESGEVEDLPGNERFIFSYAKIDIDNQREAYDQICAVNKKIATERYGSLRSDTEREKKRKEKKRNEKKSSFTREARERNEWMEEFFDELTH